MNLTKDQIEFLDRVVRGAWVINSNGEVDVDGDVWMGNLNLTEIPVKFGRVSGYFWCPDNKLTSLKNAPIKVGGYFYCGNNQLTSLEFAPTSVGGYFYCGNNQLTSLEFAPKIMGGTFFYEKNNLTNYFKNLKEEDFKYWDKLDWEGVLEEYPFLVNICKKYTPKDYMRGCLEMIPQTKIYYRD